jgi:hypothetical protein
MIEDRLISFLILVDSLLGKGEADSNGGAELFVDGIRGKTLIDAIYCWDHMSKIWHCAREKQSSVSENLAESEFSSVNELSRQRTLSVSRN